MVLALDGKRAVAIARDAHQNELDGLGRRDTDFGNQLAEIGEVRRVIGFVAADKKGFGLSSSGKGALIEERSQETFQQQPNLQPQPRIVGLKYRPLHLLVERESQQRDEPPDG